jgi:hypothetical protein
MRSYILFFLAVLVNCNAIAQTCKVSSHAFRDGESIEYSVFYNWGMIWVEAGTASFSVKQEMISTLPVYHFTGVGTTLPKYDWFYKVRDKFESYADTFELKPIHYIRNSNEGGNQVYNDNFFNFRRSIAYCSSIGKNNKVSKDSCTINICTKDVLTMIYYARSIDFSKYKVDEKIPVSLYLDGKIYNQYIRYTGKEKLKTDVGTFDCIKFSPSLIEGTIFKAGDEMMVWVTDDQNRIPIYIETPIVVGSVKVKVKKVTGNKYPLLKDRK